MSSPHPSSRLSPPGKILTPQPHQFLGEAQRAHALCDLPLLSTYCMQSSASGTKALPPELMFCREGDHRAEPLQLGQGGKVR